MKTWFVGRDGTHYAYKYNHYTGKFDVHYSNSDGALWIKLKQKGLTKSELDSFRQDREKKV